MYNGIPGITLIHVDTSAIAHEEPGARMEFLCDATADVAHLPTQTSDGIRPGSMAVDGSTGDLYVLKSTRTWDVLVEGA